jgi:flagellar hook-associated protein 1 FlgK
MTATFLSYNVASRAMEASQASINIVGNNISNINTEGYTRQRVDIVSVTTSGMVEKYATPKVSTGIGVKAKGTTQLRDPYIDARYRTQNAEANRYETMVKGLSNLEDIFDEASAEALQGELSSFINDLQSLSQSPTSSDIAQVARSAAEKITQVINMYGTQLEEVRNEQTENLEVVVKSEFNTYVKNIASLNEQIQKEEIYGNTPNELYDQRNLLIDKLSGVANIQVSMSPADKISENLEIAHYSIRIKDPSGDEKNDIIIIDNDKYAELNSDSDDVEPNPKPVGWVAPDKNNVKLSIVDTTGQNKTDINSFIVDGSLAGYLNIINGKGSFANTASGENVSKGINYYETKMNIFTNEFAKQLNTINSNIIGATGTLPLFTDNNGNTSGITARSIQVSKEWLNNPSYINTTYDKASTPASSDNVLRIIENMSAKITFSDGTEGTYNEYMTGLLGEVATDVELKTNFSKTATNVFQTISDARDSVSGVSLNEEGVNLSAFQKVYNAAMRYFNVLDENLDNIINKMGV